MNRKKENSPLPAAAAWCLDACLVDTQFGSDSDSVAVVYWQRAGGASCARNGCGSGLMCVEWKENQQKNVTLQNSCTRVSHMGTKKKRRQNPNISMLTGGSQYVHRRSHDAPSSTGALLWSTAAVQYTLSSGGGKGCSKTKSLYGLEFKLLSLSSYHVLQCFVCSTPPGTLRSPPSQTESPGNVKRNH